MALASALAASLLLAAAGEAADKNLPVPRFVTLRSDKVNLRVGPSEQYPIDWVFTRKNLPVEIVAEYGTWRKIRDIDGTEGWVHESMVAGRRAVIIRDKTRALHDKPAIEAEIVAHAEPGVVARLFECRPGWCRVEAGGVTGWIKREEIWGVYPNEVIE